MERLKTPLHVTFLLFYMTACKQRIYAILAYFIYFIFHKHIFTIRF
nr:MAG TPA: hypothetical protein [Caudoviricetes sp.]